MIRRISKIAWRFLAGLAVAAAVAILALQIEAVRTGTINTLLDWKNPYEEGTLSVGGSGGNVLTSLILTDLTLMRSGDDRPLRLDSLAVSYRPLTAFRGPLHITEIALKGLTFRAVRDSSGVLDLIAPFMPDPSRPGVDLRLDLLTIRDASVSVTDTTGLWASERLRVTLRDLRTKPDLAFRLDTLGGRIVDPLAGLPGTVVAAGSLADGVLQVDTLLYATSRSRVSAGGTLTNFRRPADQASFRILAEPLHFDDIRPLVPGLAAGGIARVDASISGQSGETTLSLDVDLGGGTVRGEVILSDGPKTARGELQLRGVDPTRILTAAGESGPSDGSVLVDLRGEDWGLLSGTTGVAVSTGKVGGVDISELQVNQTWDEGVVAFGGAGVVNGGLLDLSGTLSPAQVGMPISVRAVLTDWPLDAWSDGIPGSANILLDLEGLAGAGHLSLTARLDGTRIGQCSLDGLVEAAITSARLVSTMHLGACEGTVDGRGSYSVDSGEWVLESFAAADVRLGQLLDDTTRSSVSGFISGRRSGLESELSLALGPSFYGSFAVDSMDAGALLTGESWTAAGRLHSGPGDAAFSLSGNGTEAEIDSVAFRDLDLSRTAGLTGFESSLSGIASGFVTPEDAVVQLTLRSSRINRQPLQGGEGRITRVGDEVVTFGTVRLSGAGGISWFGRANPSTGTAVLDTLSFDELDVGALAPDIPIKTRLTGTVTGELTPDRQIGELVLDPGGTVNGLPTGGGGALFSANRDSVWARSRLLVGDGVLRMDAGLARPDQRFAGRLDISRVDAVRLAGRDTIRSSLSGTIRFDGTSLVPEEIGARIMVDSLRFSFGDIRVDTSAGNLLWEQGVLSTPAFRISGTPIRAIVSGQLPLGEDAPNRRYALEGDIDLDDVAPIGQALGFEVATSAAAIRVRGSGPKDRLQVSVDGTLDGLRWGDIHLARTEALLSTELGARLQPSAAELRVTSSVLSLPGVAAEQGKLLVTLANDSLTAQTSLRITPTRSVELHASGSRDLKMVRIETLDTRLDDASWSLVAPTDIILDDGVEISGLLAVADSQRVALGGYWGTSRGDDLFLSATNVRVDAVADLLGYRDFGATVDVAMSATSRGVAGEREINGTLSGGMSYRRDDVGRVQARIAYRDKRLSVDANLQHVTGHDARLRGFLPFSLLDGDLSAEPVSLRLEADDVPIDWTRAFVDPDLIDRLGGQVSGAVSIRGTHGMPELSGVASLTNGRVGLPDLGKPRRSLVYDQAAVFLTFHDEIVVVDSSSVRSGRGRASATGSVNLHDLTVGEVDLNILARDFLAIDSEPYRAIVSADMQVTGTTRAPQLGGSVRVSQAEFQMTDETSAAAFEPVTLSRSDLLTLERRFGLRVTEADTTNFDFYEAMTIEDLSVELARNSWLRSPRNPGVDIQFTGSMDVSKKPFSDVEVFGVIDVIPERSQIKQFGRQFNIERGSLTFNGPPEQPNMDIGAIYRVRSRGSNGDEVTIQLEATGFPDDMTISFQSDPVMDLSDIVSYIATGRPASESLQLGTTSSDSYLRSAAGLAVGPITSLVENLAGAGLGLDVVEIQQDEINGLTLTAGKYVSPRLFVSVSQPVSLSTTAGTSSAVATQVAMEYEIIQHFLVSLLSRGTVLKANLKWERSF
jgi:translocation and assembly module TamB